MRKNLNILLEIIAMLCIISVIGMISALSMPKKNDVSFIPPQFEATAVQGVPNISGVLGWGELDAQVFKVSVCGEVKMVDNSADIWFTNPKENTVWLKLRILDDSENILGETGLLKPGEYMRSVLFSEIPSKGTEIYLKIMAYEPDTYYSAGAIGLKTIVK